jgi:hypothetical protein
MHTPAAKWALAVVTAAVFVAIAAPATAVTPTDQARFRAGS